jgi:hypothetical protein
MAYGPDAFILGSCLRLRGDIHLDGTFSHSVVYVEERAIASFHHSVRDRVLKLDTG